MRKKNNETIADVDRCVCCGAYVPEGRHICPPCKEEGGSNVIYENFKSNDPRIKGLISKRAGEIFEEIIAASLVWYESRMLACIEKTPEPMKPLRPPNRQGQFLACYTKAGQPDFKGTLAGGRSVVFEAKHTDADRIKYDRLTDEQIVKLSTHHALGAVAFVLVSFGLQDFYAIPWTVWQNMKAIYGRKYVLKTETEQYRVPYENGVIKLLDGVVLGAEKREGKYQPIRLKGGEI